MSTVTIAGTAYPVQPWPTFTIQPAIQWVQDAAGYWTGSDRGASQDIYETTCVFAGRESVINALEQALDANREAVTLSAFLAPLFAPNVDHTGSLTAAVIGALERRQVQYGAAAHVYALTVPFRAIAPPLLATTPSLAGLRPQDGFTATHSNESPKAFSMTQAAYYADHRSDSGYLDVELVQNLATTQAILAYILTTARASAVAFPAALSTVIAYPWGRSRGAPTNCRFTSLQLSRMNLNRWRLKLRLVEAP